MAGVGGRWMGGRGGGATWGSEEGGCDGVEVGARRCGGARDGDREGGERRWNGGRAARRKVGARGGRWKSANDGERGLDEGVGGVDGTKDGRRVVRRWWRAIGIDAQSLVVVEGGGGAAVWREEQGGR